jgi:hypothetical protein
LTNSDQTSDEFRASLEWLYAHNFYVIPLADYIKNQIKAPAGKRPVVLTFDDGPVTQFRYLVDANGKKTIDPDSAVGILEDFYAKHPDFGRGGFFPREISNEEIKAQLAGAGEIMRGYAPKAQMEIIAVPFGVYPKEGDTTLFEGFDYQGKHYSFQAALMVGANPGPAPVSEAFDPMWIPRIRGSQAALTKWFDFVEANPGMLYVSDGNLNTITVPQKLAPALSETLDITGLHGKTLVRY